MKTVIQNRLRGGEFLIKEVNPDQVFIPEEFSEEQRLMYQTCKDFLETEVYPNLDRIDALEPGLMESLLDKSAELGLLGLSIPEEYGGLGLDFLTTMYTNEILGAGHSFSVAFLAHTGIGTLPLLYFGTKEQKERYLPKLTSGEWKAAYCLTEPNSGSDALGARTKAVLSDDRKYYILNGQKMWITNAGFADLFTVFAKIDGEHFTAFLVERNYDGISFGEEEKKMGIKGSSTRQVFFNDVKVPVENLLGEPGKGHRIAFNILNIGRLKLAVACVGTAKRVIDFAVKYANERKQFGKSIGAFGAIKQKLARMVISTYANESATYRASYDIDQTEKFLLANGEPYESALLKAAQEYAAECAIMKVYGSESLDFVVDEGVQIYGGYGYSAEYPIERAYRDSRINRIYEGTNEINRLLTVEYLIRKAMKGELDLMPAIISIQKELTAIPDFSQPEGLFGYETQMIKNFKKALLMVAGTAVQKYMQKLEEEQEVLMAIADMAIQTYVTESVYLRVAKLIAKNGEEAHQVEKAILDCLIVEAAQKIRSAGENAIFHISDGDLQRMLLLGLKRFTKIQPVDLFAKHRLIADHFLKENRYAL